MEWADFNPMILWTKLFAKEEKEVFDLQFLLFFIFIFKFTLNKSFA